MVDLVRNSPLSDRLDAYTREVTALERKLSNGAPKGKQERRRYRLRDLQKRIIPNLQSCPFL